MQKIWVGIVSLPLDFYVYKKMPILILNKTMSRFHLNVFDNYRAFKSPPLPVNNKNKFL